MKRHPPPDVIMSWPVIWPRRARGNSPTNKSDRTPRRANAIRYSAVADETTRASPSPAGRSGRGITRRSAQMRSKTERLAMEIDSRGWGERTASARTTDSYEVAAARRRASMRLDDRGRSIPTCEESRLDRADGCTLPGYRQSAQRLPAPVLHDTHARRTRHRPPRWHVQPVSDGMRSRRAARRARWRRTRSRKRRSCAPWQSLTSSIRRHQRLRLKLDRPCTWVCLNLFR